MKIDMIWPKSISNITDWSSVCEKCLHLQEQIKKLNDYMNNMSC